MQSPAVSVILPVYNAELYIKEAVESILDQTFSDFELIIINDGSSDRSEEVVKAFKDERIIYIKQENRGMAAALNHGIRLSRGELIARQDADDLAHKSRFEKQVAYMNDHPDTALLGTWANIFPSEKDRLHKHPVDDAAIKIFLLFDNPFVHSSVMIRKKVLEANGGYDENKSSLLQDYDLWSRIASSNKVANLPEVLQDYRELNTGISQTTKDYSDQVAEQSVINLLKYCSGATAEHIAYLYHRKINKIKDKVDINDINHAFGQIKIKLDPKGISNEFNKLCNHYQQSVLRLAKRYNQFGAWYFTAYSIYHRIKSKN